MLPAGEIHMPKMGNALWERGDFLAWIIILNTDKIFDP